MNLNHSFTPCAFGARKNTLTYQFMNRFVSCIVYSCTHYLYHLIPVFGGYLVSSRRLPAVRVRIPSAPHPPVQETQVGVDSHWSFSLNDYSRWLLELLFKQSTSRGGFNSVSKLIQPVNFYYLVVLFRFEIMRTVRGYI